MLKGELYLAPVQNPHVRSNGVIITISKELTRNRGFLMSEQAQEYGRCNYPRASQNDPKLTYGSDVAEKHPQAIVKGIDVSPIQPFWVPPNVKFELDDFNLPWQDSNKYDLVHARELLGSVPNWPKFYDQCFKSRLRIPQLRDPLH
jgi:hypothetical protein